MSAVRGGWEVFNKELEEGERNRKRADTILLFPTLTLTFHFPWTFCISNAPFPTYANPFY